MHVKLIWVGKTRSPSLRALAADYLERLRHLIPCDIAEAKDAQRGSTRTRGQILSSEGAAIAKLLRADSRVVILEDTGTQLTSPDFACWLEKEQNQGTRELAFVIGGPDGVAPEIAGRAFFRLSLGRMTWTHEMCRVLLLEQLYRAYAIQRKIPYHR